MDECWEVLSTDAMPHDSRWRQWMTDYSWWNKSPPVVYTPWIQWVLVVVVKVVLFEDIMLCCDERDCLLCLVFGWSVTRLGPVVLVEVLCLDHLRYRWKQSRSRPMEADAWLGGRTRRRWSTIHHQGKRWLPSRGKEWYVSLNLGRVRSAEWSV